MILSAHQEFKSRFDDLTSRRFLDAKERFKLAKTFHVWRNSSLQCMLKKKTMHKMIFIIRRVKLQRNFSLWKTVLETRRHQSRQNSRRIRALKYHKDTKRNKNLKNNKRFLETVLVLLNHLQVLLQSNQ